MDCNSRKLIIMLYIYTCVCERFDSAYINNAINVNMTSQSEVSLQGMWKCIYQICLYKSTLYVALVDHSRMLCIYLHVFIYFLIFFFENVWNVRISGVICDAIALVVSTGCWIIEKRNVLHVVCVWEGKMTGVITLYQVHLGCVHYRNRNDKN